MLKLINLKDNTFSCQQALACVEIEIENSKLEDVSALKVLHGYGSHGRGGVIALELRRQLASWKRQGFVRDYFGGDKWNMFDKEAKELLMKDKSICMDEDLGRANPGITIICL